MSRYATVEAYLAALVAALRARRADPAVIADAVADAEEHLREAARGPDGRGPDQAALAAAIAAYGAPDEIADAYADAPRPEPRVRERRRMTTNPVAAFFGVAIEARTWTTLAYLFLAFGTGIFYFVTAVVGLSLSAGLMILLIGPFIALAFLFLVRGISFFEGRMVELLLGEPMPRRQPYVMQGTGWAAAWEATTRAVTDPRTWGSLLYMVLQFALGVAYFTLFVTGFAVAAAAIWAPIAWWTGHAEIATARISIDGQVSILLTDWLAMNAWAAPLSLALGILAVFLLLHLARGLGFVHGKVAKVLLVKTPEYV